ncbi:hypothetical protein C8R47DRAFT_998961 [Mycena vitilis]|nr:hypothetical protein C8R47DRAFT_998961 [Mycena vitilis]
MSSRLGPTKTSFGGRSVGSSTRRCLCYKSFVISYSYRCDVLDKEGNRKPTSCHIDSYSNAQKKRAALTWAFGRCTGRGDERWRESEAVPGLMLGNPSCSALLASYMLSLRQRKVVDAGDTSISSRAMTEEILGWLYDYLNQQPKPDPCLRPGRNTNGWCGPKTLIQLHAINTMSFHGMLRSDEALNIQLQDIKFYKDPITHVHCFKLNLKTAKNAQFGGIHPIVFKMLLPHEAHICAVRAVATWVDILKPTSGDLPTSGPLFRHITKNDQVTDRQLRLPKCLQTIRNALMDVNVDPLRFGTHCNRHGGAKFYFHIKKKPVESICLRGRWSLNLKTSSVWKYLISMHDDFLDRQKFMDPKHQYRCPKCGR